MLSFRKFPKAASASNHVATSLARRVNNGTVDGLREPARTDSGRQEEDSAAFPVAWQRFLALQRISAPKCSGRRGLKPMRRVRYLFIIKAILKDSKVVVCWIVKAFARTSASSS